MLGRDGVDRRKHVCTARRDHGETARESLARDQGRGQARELSMKLCIDSSDALFVGRDEDRPRVGIMLRLRKKVLNPSFRKKRVREE